MALPTNRKEFKEYILRRLGFPVIEINVYDEQIEDRIDDALSHYQEYHFDGTEQGFFKHKLTQQDIDNKYISVPSNIVGISKLVEGGHLLNSASALFDVNYQVALNDFFNITSQSLIPYVMTIRHINLFREIFSSAPAIRFNRKTDKVYIDTSWDKYAVGQFIVFECTYYIDPDTHSEVWKDKWLLRYATALVKRQWGENMKKFQNIQLLGGNVMSGQEIYSEAVEELRQLEDEMIQSYSLPVTDMFG